MQTVSFQSCCDFHCWVIKYNKESIFGRIYSKDSLKDSSNLVPLLWNHEHYDINSVIGCATLEHRDEGVYAHCKLFDTPMASTIKIFLENKGSVSISPFVVKVKYDGNNIVSGEIREISLICDRVDRDEAYFPIYNRVDKKAKEETDVRNEM